MVVWASCSNHRYRRRCFNDWRFDPQSCGHRSRSGSRHHYAHGLVVQHHRFFPCIIIAALVMVVAGVFDHRQYGAAATRHRTIRRNGRQIGYNHQGDGGAIIERSIIERDQRWSTGTLVIHPGGHLRWYGGNIMVRARDHGTTGTHWIHHGWETWGSANLLLAGIRGVGAIRRSWFQYRRHRNECGGRHGGLEGFVLLPRW